MIYVLEMKQAIYHILPPDFFFILQVEVFFFIFDMHFFIMIFYTDGLIL